MLEVKNILNENNTSLKKWNAKQEKNEAKLLPSLHKVIITWNRQSHKIVADIPKTGHNFFPHSYEIHINLYIFDPR